MSPKQSQEPFMILRYIKKKLLFLKILLPLGIQAIKDLINFMPERRFLLKRQKTNH